MFCFEDLEINVIDWINTKCSRDKYESDSTYVDEIRSAYACENDMMVDACMDALVDEYYMPLDDVSHFRDEVIDLLAKEAKNMLDCFTYSDDGDEDDE